MEELLLEALLALEELDVVHEQHVVGAIAVLEALDALVAGELMKSFVNVSLVT